MSRRALRPCPVCAGDGVEVLHHQAFVQPEGCPLPPCYDVVACAACGMVYADTPAPQAAYDHYYAAFSKYEDAALASGSGVDALDARRLDQTAAAIAARLPREARILDVGCAAGGLLAALGRLGYRSLHGVDAAPGCAAAVRAQGHGAHCLPLSRLGELAAAGPFDAIILSHVLEHLADLAGVMKGVAALATPGGLVYLETPDAGRYTDYPYVPFYFFDSEHINHFDPRQLALLGARFGLRADAVGERRLEVAPGRFYPAAWAWLTNDAAAEVLPAANLPLAAAVRRYVAACGAAPRYAVLRRLADEGTQVIVWGAGSLAQRLFGEGALAACRIVAIVDRDRNKQGKRFGSFTVEAPEAALERNPDAVVLVLAAVHDAAIAGEVRALSPRARVEVLDRPAPGAAS